MAWCCDLVGCGLTCHWRERQQGATIPGDVGLDGSAGQNRLESTGDVVVVVETEDCVRLGQGLGEFSSIPFSHASHGDDGLGRASLLEVCCSQQGVH